MADPLRALILEDSPDDLALVVRELGLGGFDLSYENYQTAADLQAALAREPWDVILADYSMPGFKAPIALEVLHESGLDIPFIIVSGAIGDESAAMIMKAGAHDYVDKGNLARLVPAIQRELREVGTRRAQQEFEQALRKSEARFRVMFEESPVAIWEEDFSGVKARFDELRRSGVTDFRTHFDRHPEELLALAARVQILDINRQSVRLVGLTSAEQVPRDLPRYLTAASMPAFKEEMVALATGKRRFECEILTLDALGRPLLQHMALAVEPGCEETLAGVLVSFIDITERKRAEKAVRESARALARSQRVAHLGSWEWDIGGNSLTWSEEMYRLFGVGPDFALTDDGILQLVHPDDREMNNRLVGEMLATGVDTRFEFRIVRPDGEVRHLLQQIEVTRDGDGKAVRAFGIMLDITERKRVEEENARQLEELRRWQTVMLDREDRNMELKREVNELLRRLDEPIRYPSQEGTGRE